MANVTLNCEYVMNNASNGVANCNTDFMIDLLPLQIVIGIILLFVAWRVWVGYVKAVRPLIFGEKDGDAVGS